MIRLLLKIGIIGGAVVAAGLGLGLIEPAVAQTDSDGYGGKIAENVTEAQQPDAEPVKRIDNSTVLLGSGYDETTQRAWVEIRSDKPQSITVADSGSFVLGGTVPTETTRVYPGEPVRIYVPAHKLENGYVGVSVSTGSTLYAVPIKGQGGGSLGWAWPNVAVALLMGSITTFSAMGAYWQYGNFRDSEGVKNVG